MQVESIAVTSDSVRNAIRGRLYGKAQSRGESVVWARGGSELLVFPNTAEVRIGAGWLVAKIEVQTDQTGRLPLHVVYALGRAGEGDGLRVASTLQVADPSGLLTHWGEALQEALWVGVLDAVESGAASLPRGAVWIPQGISADDKAITVTYGGAR